MTSAQLQKQESDLASGARGHSPWKLFQDGFIIFEGIGPSRPLFTRIDICSQPMCDCSEVLLTALCLDPDEISVSASQEEMEAKLSGPEAMTATIDVGFGTVTPEAFGSAKPLTSEWIDYLKVAIDPNLLEVLHRAWLEAKQARDASQQKPHRGASRVGRNNLCPCGSGKKHKRCCA